MQAKGLQKQAAGTAEKAHSELTGLLCRPNVAVTPCASVDTRIPRISGLAWLPKVSPCRKWMWAMSIAFSNTPHASHANSIDP